MPQTYVDCQDPSCSIVVPRDETYVIEAPDGKVYRICEESWERITTKDLFRVIEGDDL